MNTTAAHTDHAPAAAPAPTLPGPPAAVPLSDRLSDRFHPVLIKELRQATRSGFLAVSLLLILASQVFTLAIAIAAADTNSLSPEAGQMALAWSTFSTLCIAIIVIPSAFGIRLSAERADFCELITATPLGNQSILTGKIKTAILLELLLASSTLPFMALTYLLRGIDIFSIFTIAVFDTIIASLATVYALSIASFVTHTIARIFAAAFILFGLLIALYIATIISILLITFPSDFDSIMIIGIGLFLLIPAAVIFVLFMVALNRLNPTRFGDGVYRDGQMHPYRASMHQHTTKPFIL